MPPHLVVAPLFVNPVDLSFKDCSHVHRMLAADSLACSIQIVRRLGDVAATVVFQTKPSYYFARA